MSDPVQTETAYEVRRLRYQVDSLTEEVGLIKVRGRAAAAAFFCIAAIAVNSFGPAEDAEEEVGDSAISLWSLVDQAEAVSNGTVNVFSVITIVALVVSVLWCAYALLSRTRLTSTLGYVLGGVTLAAWVVLFVVVQVSGGEGAIDELGYEGAIGTLLVPIAALLTIATAHAVRSSIR